MSTAWPICCAGPGVGFDALSEVARIASAAPLVSRETLAAEWGAALADAVIEQVEIATKYAGYIDKQSDEVARALHFEDLPLAGRPGLRPGDARCPSRCGRSSTATGPQTLGQASRISGVTPAAISLLLVHLKKKRLSAGRLRAADAGRRR